MQRVGHWINGTLRPATQSSSFEVRNPLDDSVYAIAARGDLSDVADAAGSASEFAAEYARSTPSDREQWLITAAGLLQQRADAFSEVLIDEIGSSISKARMEIGIAVRNLTATAAMARQVGGKIYPTDGIGRWSLGFRKPIGVVAGITPFNVPLIKGVKHSSMALATGNPFVWLPSDQAPVTASMLTQLYCDAGVPPNALQLVLGHGVEIGDALVTDPRVAAVGFTGSHRVGRHVQRLCGENGKRVTLELGGINPLVVWEDANMEAAVKAALLGGFLYQGQICMASSRVIVHRSRHDEFVKRLCGAARGLPMGDLRDPTTVIGPIISEKQRQRIRELVADATQKGARIFCGGRWHENKLEPTVLCGVTDDMRLHAEEVFGPVVTVSAADDFSDALSQANATPFGLVASVFTENLDLAMRFADQIDAGMVHINAMTIQQEPQVPFGGNGESGFGREGLETGLDDMTQWKWVTLGPSNP
ncbi:putative aldehyde dehydrogenase AldY [Stieleria varia]|uniref:Putative aldehyde dehydrogenase AldY n=2 Tax=Stieleria varia TaxID=2528005 RepID=A0A5C6AXR8_9BACT|nr:putative aldehyde dehydrogenase AldY [Stieleria varia]